MSAGTTTDNVLDSVTTATLKVTLMIELFLNLHTSVAEIFEICFCLIKIGIGDCDLYPTLDFFDSLVVSNLEQEWKDMVELQTEVPIILYAFIIFWSVILILIFISIYWLWKISYNFYNDSKLSYQEFQDFNSNNYILEENSSKISKYDSNTHTVDSTNFNP